MTFRRPQQSTLVAEALANEADYIAYLWSQEPKTKTIPKGKMHGMIAKQQRPRRICMTFCPEQVASLKPMAV